MNCPICKLVDMRVDRVKDGTMYLVCKKCGRQETREISELEKEDE